MPRYQTTCLIADVIRMNPEVRAFGGCTNWVGGEVLDPHLPACTSTVWGVQLKDGREVEVLYEEFDLRGCRHWILEEDPNEDS